MVLSSTPESATRVFRLRALGGLSIESADGPVSALIAQRKLLALLTALAAAGERGVSRDRLLALLWPERDADRARNTLAQLVFRARRDLGADAIRGNSDLSLNVGVVTSDIVDFSAAFAARAFEKACAIYSGPFLEGFHLRDASEFEDWVSRERHRLEAQWFEALESVASSAAKSGDPAGAARWWATRAAAEPLSARVACSYAGALVTAGDREAAIRFAGVYGARVREELSEEPEPAVLAAATARPPRLAPAAETAPLPATRDSERTLAPLTVPTASRAARWLRPSIGIAVLFIGAILTARWHTLRDVRPDGVLVTYVNATGDKAYDALAVSLAQTSSELIGRGGRLRVIDAPSPPNRGGSERAALVVTGTIHQERDSLIVTSRVTPAFGGGAARDLPAIAVTIGEGQDLAARVRSQVAGAVAALSDRRVRELARAAALPSYDAYIEYVAAADALTRENQPGVSEARMHLHRAMQIDSAFITPAFLLLQFAGGRADSILAALEAQRARMSTLEQLLIDAARLDRHGSAEEYYEAVRRAADAAPDDPGVLRLFADAAMKSNHFAAAIKAYHTLERDSSWMGGLYETWEADLDAHHQIGDFKGALTEWRSLRPRLANDFSVCLYGVLQYGASGRLSAIDSLVATCVPNDMADPNRLGRRISTEDELYRRAGRELLWHGHDADGRRALEHAYALETSLFSRDSSANDGWLAAELLSDWPRANRLLHDEIDHRESCGAPPGPRPCPSRTRLRFAVTAAHVGDTATAVTTLSWIDAQQHTDSLFKVERSKILLALGRRDEAVRSLHDAARTVATYVWMHANTELLPLRGDKTFEALVAPRP